MSMPTRTLGRTGAVVSALGLGGEGVLRTHGRGREAAELVRRALDLGVTYFESARAYAGSEEYLGRALGPDRQRVFLATKSHLRTRRGARAHLDESLALLRTDWVDLWFAHDLRTPADLEALAAPGGALQAFTEAKERGEVRFLGASGHEDPAILQQALDLFPFDCLLLPVNPAEAALGSFADVVIPAAVERGVGVVAMKTLCRGMALRFPGISAGALLRYALSQEGVCLASVGCDDPDQLEANVRAVAGFTPMAEAEREALEQALWPHARQLAYYRPPPQP